MAKVRLAVNRPSSHFLLTGVTGGAGSMLGGGEWPKWLRLPTRAEAAAAVLLALSGCFARTEGRFFLASLGARAPRLRQYEPTVREAERVVYEQMPSAGFVTMGSAVMMPGLFLTSGSAGLVRVIYSAGGGGGGGGE